ncbi:MAG: D-aminoacyl-tRNA deacylase [Candidatus Anstonellales archaeon]
MHPIIVFSSRNVASKNIAEHLVRLGFKKIGESEWKYKNIRLLDTRADSILNVPTDFEEDYMIVLSTHKSEMSLPTLTVHITGNWDSADFGGEPRTLNIAYAGKMLQILRYLKKYGQELEKSGWQVCYEVDHHGPTCKKPIMFVEIGSTEKEWRNKEAGKAVAKAVFDAMNKDEEQEFCFFGVGGGHYAPKFTKLALEKNMAFGHILPKYRADSIAEDTFRQAIEKNVERLKAIVLDWKGLNKEQRDRVVKLAEKFGIDIIRE